MVEWYTLWEQTTNQSKVFSKKRNKVTKQWYMTYLYSCRCEVKLSKYCYKVLFFFCLTSFVKVKNCAMWLLCILQSQVQHVNLLCVNLLKPFTTSCSLHCRSNESILWKNRLRQLAIYTADKCDKSYGLLFDKIHRNDSKAMTEDKS